MTEPTLTLAQAERIVAALDTSDGGYESIAAFVLALAQPSTPPVLIDGPREDEGCICKGNWRAIVSEGQHLLERMFTSHDDKVFRFFGFVHGNDDYYYGMWTRGELRLLSCVGSIEGHGYKLIDAALSQSLPPAVGEE